MQQGTGIYEKMLETLCDFKAIATFEWFFWFKFMKHYEFSKVNISVKEAYQIAQ